jgi:hypothetical protein
VQYALVQRGVPLAWTVDVPRSHPLFAPVQLLAAAGALSGPGPRRHRLEVKPDEPLTVGEAEALVGSAARVLVREDGAGHGLSSARVQDARTATKESVESLLQTHGLPVRALSDPPLWVEVVDPLSTLIGDVLGR